jgi:hypothetical protein
MSRSGFLRGSAVLLAVSLLGGSLPEARADFGEGGDIYGSWELPSQPDQFGFASGVLGASAHLPGWFLEAVLTEEDGTDELRFGDVLGVLTDRNDPTVIRASVVGTWQGPRGETTGGWTASAYDWNTGAWLFDMGGSYDDPARGEGTFDGFWGAV